MNRRVEIQVDIKHEQNTLSYTSSKVDYNMGENIYMLSSDMNPNIRSGIADYNNKILISDGEFVLGKDDRVDISKVSNRLKSKVVEHKLHKDLAQEPTNSQTVTHEEKKRRKLPWYSFCQVAI